MRSKQQVDSRNVNDEGSAHDTGSAEQMSFPRNSES